MKLNEDIDLLFVRINDYYGFIHAIQKSILQSNDKFFLNAKKHGCDSPLCLTDKKSGYAIGLMKRHYKKINYFKGKIFLLNLLTMITDKEKETAEIGGMIKEFNDSLAKLKSETLNDADYEAEILLVKQNAFNVIAKIMQNRFVE
jgi:hypothetical protein